MNVEKPISSHSKEKSPIKPPQKKKKQKRKKPTHKLQNKILKKQKQT